LATHTDPTKILGGRIVANFRFARILAQFGNNQSVCFLSCITVTKRMHKITCFDFVFSL
jgi:hypothetical protein